MSIRIGYAAGAFDLFHVGHLNMLRQAKSHCDFLVAGAVSDELCLMSKGRLPVVPLNERMEILRHIDLVDHVVTETSSDRLEVWRRVGFNVFFKGNDWQGTQKGIDIETKFAAVGVQVTYFPYTVHTSSTVLRRTLERLTSGGDALSGPPGAQA